MYTFSVVESARAICKKEQSQVSLYEQSLLIYKEIGDKSGEGTTLNNISGIYNARGDYETALNFLNQSLAIRQEIGNKSGEGATLNNISQNLFRKINKLLGVFPAVIIIGACQTALCERDSSVYAG